MKNESSRKIISRDDRVGPWGRCGKEYIIVKWVHISPPPPTDNGSLKLKTLEWTKGDITNGRQRVN
jgi:hypothetical protein